MDKLTEIIFILDNSGSMHYLKEETIIGFNNFVEEQKKVEGKALLTLVLFNSTRQVVYTEIPLEEVEPLSKETYKPDGYTALLDTVGSVVNTYGTTFKYLIPEEDKPDKVIVVILTDGEENVSRSFTKEQVNQCIKKAKEEDGWEFIFLGANQDSFKTGRDLSINRGDTFGFEATEKGIGLAYENISKTVTHYRK